MDFLDTNIIIRYVTGDNPDHSARSLAFLREVEVGRREVMTCEGVLVEAVQILESKRLYAFPRPAIRDALSDILNMRGFHVAHKQIYIRALELYASSNLDFVDVLEVAHMENQRITTVVSFDQGFDQIPGIVREEP